MITAIFGLQNLSHAFNSSQHGLRSVHSDEELCRLKNPARLDGFVCRGRLQSRQETGQSRTNANVQLIWH